MSNTVKKIAAPVEVQDSSCIILAEKFARELKVVEKKHNGHAKDSVSCNSNSGRRNLPKRRNVMKDEGIVTKHNSDRNGRRNADLLMTSNVPEMDTGDMREFDIKIPDAAYNNLNNKMKKKCPKKTKFNKLFRKFKKICKGNKVKVQESAKAVDHKEEVEVIPKSGDTRSTDKS